MDKELNITEKYVCFWGSVFSNFYPATIHAEGLTFPTSEHYFMWQKARFFNDEIIAKCILLVDEPRDAKRLGRRVDGFDDDAWNEFKIQAMFNAVYKKFSENEDLKKILLSEEFKDRHFVEGSPVDRIWGVGLKFDDPDIADEKNWKGENLLGQVLDCVRECLMEKSDVKTE